MVLSFLFGTRVCVATVFAGVCGLALGAPIPMSEPCHSPAKFLPGERVAFVGDSITHAGGYIAYMQMFLMELYPTNPPHLYNCGVNGDTAGSFLLTKRHEWDVLPLQPDRVFIMMGMNDVNRDLWKTVEPTSEEASELRTRTLVEYEKNMRQLVKAILPKSKNVVLMTPTPYDQYGKFDGHALLGCNDPGLSFCANIVRKISFEMDLPIVELYFPLTQHLKDSAFERLCGDDRIHPGCIGHSLIASLILRSCGHSSMDDVVVAKELRDDPCAGAAVYYAKALSAFRRIAEYKKVIRSMGADPADAQSDDRALDRWLESGLGAGWYGAAQLAVRDYRDLRGREVQLSHASEAAFNLLSATVKARVATPGRRHDD